MILILIIKLTISLNWVSINCSSHRSGFLSHVHVIYIFVIHMGYILIYIYKTLLKTQTIPHTFYFLLSVYTPCLSSVVGWRWAPCSGRTARIRLVLFRICPTCAFLAQGQNWTEKYTSSICQLVTWQRKHLATRAFWGPKWTLVGRRGPAGWSSLAFERSKDLN